MKRAAFVLLAAALSGCVTVGRPFRATQVPLIEIGRTTDRDLLKIFGEPYRTGIDDGDKTWTYLYYKLRAFGDQKTRDLYIRFGSDGRVMNYSFNSNFPEDRR